MKINWLRLMITIMLSIPVSIFSVFAEITPPHEFVDGEKAYASEVNANFDTVYDKVNELEALVASLQSRIEALEASNAMALDPYVSVASDGRGPLVQFSGVNLQVVNGLGATGGPEDPPNGLGNLIVGYDEVNDGEDVYTCSDARFQADESTCTENGGDWGNNFKTGSHYLVLGTKNSYAGFGGLVAGSNNFATGPLSVVTGGIYNLSGAPSSSVSGGRLNTATGPQSSVSGGYGNTASGKWSSVSGGQNNTASSNESSVSGGANNTASGLQSSVSGGSNNAASGTYSSVSGGNNREATDENDWAAGPLYEDY